MVVARATSWSAVRGRPCALRTLRAWSEPEHALRILLTWEEALRSFAIVTPSTSIDVTLTIPKVAGSDVPLTRRRWMIISWDLLSFSRRLFLKAHSDTFSHSLIVVFLMVAPLIK